MGIALGVTPDGEFSAAEPVRLEPGALQCIALFVPLQPLEIRSTKLILNNNSKRLAEWQSHCRQIRKYLSYNILKVLEYFANRPEFGKEGEVLSGGGLTAGANALQSRSRGTGDVVLLLTDGILEAHGADEALFGAERAVEVVRANRTKTAKEMVHILCTRAREFCSYRTQVDDMTTIIITAREA